MKFDTRNDVAEKMKRAMGADQKSALDMVRRGDFKNDDEYLDAAAHYEISRQTPEFQKARRELAKELAERWEAEQREKQREEYSRLLKTVKLDYLDRKNIDAKAAELAQRDVHAGRIGASALGSKITEYAKVLEEKRIEEKAQAALVNAMIRDAWR